MYNTVKKLAKIQCDTGKSKMMGLLTGSEAQQ